MTDLHPAVSGSGARASAGGRGSEVAAARRIVLGFLFWGIAALLTLRAVAPPSALAPDAESGRASGGRALEILERLARGGVDAGQVSPPRPIGSAANERCRQRILDELRSLGLRPEVHEEFGASARFRCAGTVRNVVCRLRGQDTFGGASGESSASSPGQAILCMAHLDSVGAGPGVGDDLAGVAAWIEVARALMEGGSLQRDVIFLFEDGEEHGLLGAEVFAAKHPWAREVGAVINLEGRGTSGPSRLFETGAGNDWIMRAFRAESTAPSSTSVSSEIYKRMPNDTDYTVWRDRGVPGLNFAFIGGVNRYHTPLDDLAKLSEASLQHHVTNAFEAVKALAASPELPRSDASTGDAVYFDVLGRFLVIYGVRTARLLAILLLIGALLAAARSIRAGHVRLLRVLAAFVGVGVALGLGYGGALGANALYEVFGAGTGVGHPAHLGPVLVGLLGGAAAGLGLGALLLTRFSRAADVGVAVTVLIAGLGAMAAWEAPGVSFLLAIPATVLVVGGGLLRLRGNVDARWARVGLVALVVSAVLALTPIHSGLIDAFGVRLPGVAAAPWLFGGLLLLPSLVDAGRAGGAWLAGLGGLTALVAATLLLRLDTHTAVEPGHLNLVHVQQEDAARWQILGGLDAVDPGLLADLTLALTSAGDEAEAGVKPGRIPWAWKPLATVPAPMTADEPPRLEWLAEMEMEDGNTLLRARAIPGRRSDLLLVKVSGSGSLVVDGVTMPGGAVRLLGPPDEGVELTYIRDDAFMDRVVRDLGEKTDAPVVMERTLTVELWSQQFGLRGVRGRAAESYFRSRPAEFVPFADGDGSLIHAVFRQETAEEETAEEDSADR
ncbi:MraY-like glycosyltransferase [Planctomycetes bacterium Poly30]|uniref:MraY-like glycosyltransferase n=1 Tax=Saltatorellus ferox TaxID=2528018 RepID=A0A518EVK0_9BACT|nr:MraY-like glycosyltransferase [Planctomycetes bacterium Poly30]